MKNGLIILEGPDQSGKTTLAKQFVRHGVCYMHCINLPNEFLTKYHDGVLQDACISAQYNIVVLDRHWPSRLIYQNNLESRRHADFILNDYKIKPIYIFCLTDKCLELHKKNKDPDHPYHDVEFKRVYREYGALYLAMKSKYPDHVELFDMEKHGIYTPYFIKEILER